MISTAIGIFECWAPQISEHCPYSTPGIKQKKFTWFNRPGLASAFTPNLGTVQECRTSALVTKIRVCVLRGKIRRLSTSSWRNIPLSSSDSGVI